MLPLLRKRERAASYAKWGVSGYRPESLRARDRLRRPWTCKTSSTSRSAGLDTVDEITPNNVLDSVAHP
jgi:hypothetical protein